MNGERHAWSATSSPATALKPAASSKRITTTRHLVLRHRRLAITITLNPGEYEGGELTLPEFGSTLFRPPTGDALVFGCGLLHVVRPVTRGRRYAFLPFLYDEEAAALRERNRASLV